MAEEPMVEGSAGARASGLGRAARRVRRHGIHSRDGLKLGQWQVESRGHPFTLEIREGVSWIQHCRRQSGHDLLPCARTGFVSLGDLNGHTFLIQILEHLRSKPSAQLVNKVAVVSRFSELPNKQFDEGEKMRQSIFARS